MNQEFKNYLLRVAALISQIINCIFLFGHQDQTICSRCYQNKDRRKIYYYGYRFFNFIVFWQKDHCKASFDRDVEFAKEILG